MTVTPAEMGFPHVLQLARLDRIRVLKGGQQEAETVWLITSLSPDQANASRLLALARQYWSIENGLHYRLDVSSAEDRCRGCAIRWQRRSWASCAEPAKANTGTGPAASVGRVRVPAQSSKRR